MEQDSSLKRYTLIAAALAAFLTPFMGSSINLAIPTIGKSLTSNTYLLSWVVTSYLLASAAFLIPIGRLSDILGRKKIFALGIFSFSLFSFLCGLAWSIKLLIIFRVLQGIGSAMIFGTSMAILTSVFPAKERGKALGINVASVYTGLSLGPVLGGTLNHQFGWHSIFYFNAILGISVFLIVVFKMKGEWAGNKGETFDIIGSLLYLFGLTALMYGMSSISNDIIAKYILIAGIIILILFVRYELKIKNPVLDFKLFKSNVAFTMSNLAAFINYAATFGVVFLLSLYLQEILGYDSQKAGLILLSQPIFMALLSPFAGTLSDKIEPRIVATLGMAVTTVSLTLFCFLSATTPLWFLVLSLIILGIGLALFSSPNSNAVMSSVDKKFYGIASSTLGTMRLVGQSVSMALITLVISLYTGKLASQGEYAVILLRSNKAAFLIFSIICFLGIFASFKRGKVRETAK